MSTSESAVPGPGSEAKWGLSDEDLASRPLVFRAGMLAGQTWLISGGGSGFGRAMAYATARLGANVMICGRRAEKLAATRDGIHRLLGLEVATTAMTIRDPEAVANLMDATYARFGRISTLINNGGGQYPQAAIDFSTKGWLAVIDTNLNGTWHMMQAAARRWRERGEAGNIVNIVANVWRGMPQLAHSCAARAGVIYLSKTLSTEWAPYRIRVNCISPGPFNSEGMNAYEKSSAELFRYSNPLHQFGDPLDLAQAAVFLSSAAAPFITGEVLVMDGGNSQLGDVWPNGVPDYFKVPDPV